VKVFAVAFNISQYCEFNLIGRSLPFINKTFFCALLLLCCHTSAAGVPSWDIDKNGSADALTDGLIILRHLFDVSGNDLIDGVVASDSPLKLQEIQDSLNETIAISDVDKSGHVDALTDGLMIMRYLFDVRGSELVQSVVHYAAKRKDHADIFSYLSYRMPELSYIQGVVDIDNLVTGTWTAYQDYNEYISYLNPDIYNIFSVPNGYHELVFSRLGNVTFVEFSDVGFLHCSGSYSIDYRDLAMSFNCTLNNYDNSSVLEVDANDVFTFSAEVTALVSNNIMTNVIVNTSIEDALFDIYTLYRNDFFIVSESSGIKPGVYGTGPTATDPIVFLLMPDGRIESLPVSGCYVTGQIINEHENSNFFDAFLMFNYAPKVALISYSNCNGSSKEYVPFILRAGTSYLDVPPDIAPDGAPVDAVFFASSENVITDGILNDSTWTGFVQLCDANFDTTFFGYQYGIYELCLLIQSQIYPSNWNN
jgi:hypothetical protein